MKKSAQFLLFLLLCLVLSGALLAGLIFYGKMSAPQPVPEAPTETLTEATADTEPSVQPTTEAPTQAPSEAPTTQPPTEKPTTAPTEPPLILHSGLREDGTFSEGTMFVGDSLTFLMVSAFLKEKGPEEGKLYIGDAKYACKAGVQVTAFNDSRYPMTYDPNLNCLYVPEFKDMTMQEAAASMGESMTAFYFMMGTNYTPNASADTYIEICDFILENCPNATIHLQLIPMVDTSKVAVPYKTVNERIQAAFDHYQEIGEPRVTLLDTGAAVGNNLISDGVHMSNKGREAWYQAICDHAAEYNMAT